MTTATHQIIAKLQQQRNVLEQIPERSKIGFAQVAELMGQFSVGFAAGTTQAFAVRERLAANKNDLGLKPLREDYRQINQEINAVFQDITQLVGQGATIKEPLQQITTWALELEQEAFLPAIVDQIKGHGSNELERQTLGSIIDSLMRQVRTLLHEVILSTQESTNLLNSLNRRLSADLETSKHHFTALKSRSTTLMKQMTEEIKEMDTRCEGMENHTTQVNNVIFEMVQAIQYDDISTQRLDHAIKTVGQIEQRLTQTHETGTNHRWAAIATSIVIKQLENISTDLVTAVQSLHQHLTQIGSIGAERKKSVLAARDNGMVFQQDVLDLFYHLSALLRMSIFDNDFSMELLRHFSKTENAIFQGKRAFDTLLLTTQRLEKLLTTLDCKNSRRLETLTGSIGQLLGRIKQEGHAQNRRLLEITKQLQEISLDYSEQSTPKIMRATTLLRRVPLRAQQMEADHNEVLRVFHETIGETQAIIVQTKLLVAEMDFHHRIQKGTDRITQNLKALITELVDPEIADTLQGDLSRFTAEFEDLSRLYTMASERKAHETALGTGDTTQAETTDEDGFELF